MRPTYAEVEHALLGRWPETKLEPSLTRIKALCDLLGDPQNSYPIVSLTGTNGKTSTSRMIDNLLRALDLRTGRFTSPHLESMRERICIDGEPLSEELFVDAFADVAAYAQVVDDSSEHPLSFFELIVAMAYAAFADAPVEAGIVEVGMGGTWDATNVADAQVAVVTPIDVDHSRYLGGTPEEIAVEKAGIIKARSHAVLANQSAGVADVLLERVASVGATVVREGIDFGVSDRNIAVGGQLLTIAGTARSYDEIFLPLHGAFQAQNAACAIAAVEGFVGGKELDEDLVREAFASLTSPGRLEVLRRSPTVLLDSAHNPHGVRATVEAVQEAFALSPLVGVVGVMADKEVDDILDELEPALAQIVCTQNTTDRAMPAAELADIAEGIFGVDRVHLAPRLDDAIERAIELAEFGGVLITGSVVTAGQARILLGGSEDDR
ncbi:bifunctional folylpolyglutamate synthase/dihydrofolate synthase [Nocardioidaceae bacterium SCSIO 66511]|nr:bifunctional folylpolyglutamate synthase/dihydrofolate synthase [Nocardioidaceae bacterium SCSIO 66511]